MNDESHHYMCPKYEVDCECCECQCWFISGIEQYVRETIAIEEKSKEEAARLYALAVLTRDGDTVRVKIDDGDKIFGTIEGNVVRTGALKTGVSVGGVQIVDPHAKRVSDHVKEITIVTLGEKKPWPFDRQK